MYQCPACLHRMKGSTRVNFNSADGEITGIDPEVLHMLEQVVKESSDAENMPTVSLLQCQQCNAAKLEQVPTVDAIQLDLQQITEEKDFNVSIKAARRLLLLASEVEYMEYFVELNAAEVLKPWLGKKTLGPLLISVFRALAMPEESGPMKLAQLKVLLSMKGSIAALTTHIANIEALETLAYLSAVPVCGQEVLEQKYIMKTLLQNLQGSTDDDGNDATADDVSKAKEEMKIKTRTIGLLANLSNTQSLQTVLLSYVDVLPAVLLMLSENEDVEVTSRAATILLNLLSKSTPLENFQAQQPRIFNVPDNVAYRAAFLVDKGDTVISEAKLRARTQVLVEQGALIALYQLIRVAFLMENNRLPRYIEALGRMLSQSGKPGVQLYVDAGGAQLCVDMILKNVRVALNVRVLGLCLGYLGSYVCLAVTRKSVEMLVSKVRGMKANQSAKKRTGKVPAPVLVDLVAIIEAMVGVHEMMNPKATDEPTSDLPSCALCGIKRAQQTPLQRCSRCKDAHYCSTAHQQEDWSKHKKLCTTVKQKPLVVEVN